jgi:hypothetical protein
MPLKDESEPISDDEWLVRQVYIDRFREHEIPFISPTAFQPRHKGYAPDEDGISLFREACLDGHVEVLELIADLEKRKKIGLVRVRVSDLLALKLSVVATPIEQVRGHVSIPELSAEAWRDADGLRKKCRAWMDQLAELASQPTGVVIDPTADASDE